MNINELEQLAKAATHGPWMYEPTGAENTVFGDTRSNVIRIGDSIPKKQAKDRRHKDCKSI